MSYRIGFALTAELERLNATCRGLGTACRPSVVDRLWNSHSVGFWRLVSEMVFQEASMILWDRRIAGKDKGYATADVQHVTAAVNRAV